MCIQNLPLQNFILDKLTWFSTYNDTIYTLFVKKILYSISHILFPILSYYPILSYIILLPYIILYNPILSYYPYIILLFYMIQLSYIIILFYIILLFYYSIYPIFYIILLSYIIILFYIILSYYPITYNVISYLMLCLSCTLWSGESPMLFCIWRLALEDINKVTAPECPALAE